MRYAWLIVLAVVATTGCNQAELKKALAEAKEGVMPQVQALRQEVAGEAELAAAMLAATVARRAVAEPLERLLASRNVVASDAAAPGTLAGMPRTRF